MTDQFIIYKIGNIELYGCDCQKLIEEKRIFLITYKTIYQLCYSVNAGYYGIKLYYQNDAPFTKRGRFFAYTADDANRLLGHDLFV